MVNQIFIALILLVASFSYSEAANCTAQQDCDSCSATEGCGWCAPTQQCLAGNVTGPSQGQCLGSSWEWKRCTPCQALTDCRSCLTYDQDCFWCATANGGAGGCKNIGFFGCTYTKTCPCEAYHGCGDCIDDANCQWCAASETCQNITTTCSSAPSFNYTTDCPCYLNTECSSCREDAGCKWCNQGVCDTQCAGGTGWNSCGNYCDQGTNCGECTALVGCAWCANDGKCVDPASATCKYSYTCPDCNFATYCDACISSPYCVWCEDSGSCQEKGTTCSVAYGCDAYCDQYSKDCELCNKVKGCGYCEDGQRCVDADKASCLFSHTCTAPPSENCGFNGGAFVGGMFLMLGIILLGVIGYAFYRWRTGHRIQYTELK